MDQDIKTLIRYSTGATEYDIPFDYLSRKFVRVSLVSDDNRRLLSNITEYRYVSKTRVKILVDTTGFDRVEIRRFTSASERVVDFSDGSVLRANDLNVSQLQSSHIAEEARDSALLAMPEDDAGNLDARNRKIVRLAPGEVGTDAVNKDQLDDGLSHTLRVSGENLQPLSGDRTGKVLSFDSAGNPILRVPVADSSEELAVLLASDEGARNVFTSRGASVEDELADLISRQSNQRVFNIMDFGAKPDYVRTKNDHRNDWAVGEEMGTIGTDSFGAINLAAAMAWQYNGRVYVPGCPRGYAFYSSQGLKFTTSYQMSVGITGDGSESSMIVCGQDGLIATASAGSGNPSNVAFTGFTILSHLFRNPGYTGLTEGGMGFVKVYDVNIRNFETNHLITNDLGGGAGVFTEVVSHSRMNNRNAVYGLKFRKGAGDASMHGVNFNGYWIDGFSGIGLDIGAGVNLYNSDFIQFTIFPSGDNTVSILNNGSRSGVDHIYFEGNGIHVENNGGWVTTGMWRVQNNIGLINSDTSTRPFNVQGSYDTPIALGGSVSAPVFSSLGITNLRLSPKQNRPTASMGENLVLLKGQEINSIGFVGLRQGSRWGSQGFFMLSQLLNDPVSSLRVHSAYSLNGISVYDGTFSMGFGTDANQFKLNSNGYFTGRMGRRFTATLDASASQQVITIPGLISGKNTGLRAAVHFRDVEGNVLMFYGAGFCLDGQTLPLKAQRDTVNTKTTAISFSESSGVATTDGLDLVVRLTTSLGGTLTVTCINDGIL